MAAINDVESKLLIDFRKRIADLVFDEFGSRDEALVRWIRARDYNLNKAEEMIRKSHNWKKEYDIENLLNWKPPPEYLIKFSYKICGYDSDDSPVVICRFGAWDVRTVIEAGNRDLFLKYLQWISVTFLQHMKNLMKMKNKFISQFVLIFDIDGFSFRQISSISTLETLMESVRQYEDNYPESLKAAYIININKIYGIGFNLIKPLLTMRTVSKITAYDRYSEKWKSIITSDKFKLDHTIFSYETNEFNEGEDFDTVVIKARDKVEFEVKVGEVGSTLGWKFKTDSHDIGFGINFQGNDSKLKQVFLPTQRVLACNRMQRNSLVCKNTGKYTFVFDNSYSRIRSKTIHYCVTLENK